MTRGRKTSLESKIRFKQYWKTHPAKRTEDLIEGFRDSGQHGTSERDVGERTLRGFVAEFRREETSGDSWNIDWDNSPDDIALQFLLKKELEMSGSDGLGELRLKWIRRLKGIFENSVDAPELLLKWSNNYAKREYACITAKVPVDTSDLDDCLIFRKWEDPTLYEQVASRRYYWRYRELDDLVAEVLWVTAGRRPEVIEGLVRDLKSGADPFQDLNATPDTRE